MNSHLTVSDLKSFAKEHLFGNYPQLVTSVIIAQLLVWFLSRIVASIADTSSMAGLIIYYLIYILINLLAGILSYGESYQYLSVASGKPTSVSDLFNGFRQSGEQNAAITQTALVMALLTSLFTIPVEVFLNLYYSTGNDTYLIIISILLVVLGIPVIIVSLMFSQVYFILLDFPRYHTKEAFALSIKLMKGNKWRLMRVILSFIPMLLLGIMTLGLGLLWIGPYMNCTMAEFYLDLVKKVHTEK
ncbi:MAG: DUF975 family protein [Lachnospiraceae bacterium]|nr:DUF975 family protein [Lachnospiraceae bacterium]